MIGIGKHFKNTASSKQLMDKSKRVLHHFETICFIGLAKLKNMKLEIVLMKM